MLTPLSSCMDLSPNARSKTAWTVMYSAFSALDRAGQDGVSMAACAGFIPTGSSAQ